MIRQAATPHPALRADLLPLGEGERPTRRVLDARRRRLQIRGVAFFLAHLSDAHIGPLPAPLKRELIGKRFTGWLNWTRGRRLIHDMDVLARIVEDIRAHRPDHIAMTGDILNIGLPSEFPMASAWLDTLGPRDAVSFVPGNHDAYVRGSMPYVARVFAPWTHDGGAGPAEFPYLRQRGRIALIGVSSGTPTPPFIASGRVGGPQRKAVGRLLESARARGLLRVVMIHHPPYRRGATPGRGLADAAEFESVLWRHGAELIVHGHNHRASLRKMASRHGSIPVVGVPSASAVPGSVGHRAGWHLFEFEERPAGWSIELRHRGFQSGRTGIGEIARERIA